MKGNTRLLVFIPVFVLFACSHKSKVSLSGEEPVDIRDFIKAFDPVELPYQVADTDVVKKPGDSLLLTHKLLGQFIPDTAFNRLFGRTDKAKIYPLSRVTEAGNGAYLFVKDLSNDRKSIVLLCFDKKNKFVTGMPVLVPDANPSTQQLFSIDKRLTISKNVTRKNADGTISDGKDVYVLNEPSRSFMLIMTDALDAPKVELINPVESLPRKNKYSGDYVKDKWNLVSIRDDKRQGRLNFFVHFEKKNNCTGELRGEATLTSGNVAVYRSGGDFCVLQFRFTTSSVTIAEMEGCGSHRGIQCVFEGTFPKKKEVKKKEIPKQKSSSNK